MPFEERAGATVCTHPLARETLTALRDASTEPPAFRSALRRLGHLVGWDLVGERFGTEPVRVETPMGESEGVRVRGTEDVVLVGVLRAAGPMMDGLAAAVPAARQGFVAAGRNEAAGMDEDGRFPIDLDYVKLPTIREADTVIVVDPMLATGSTMCAVLEAIRERGGERAELLAVSAVSAPAGVERVRESTAAEVVTVAVDERLDDEGFIVPGLGDAGDRAFGTE